MPPHYKHQPVNAVYGNNLFLITQNCNIVGGGNAVYIAGDKSERCFKELKTAGTYYIPSLFCGLFYK
jgi:hypothetical protein